MTLVGVVALSCAAAAHASDQPIQAVSIGAPVTEPSDEVKPGGGSAQDEKPAAGAKAPKPPRSLFRCWQDGRLIFEGRGYGALPQSPSVAELKSSDGGSGRVQVMDLYQGVCVLELPK
jgi:hypothetical protein